MPPVIIAAVAYAVSAITLKAFVATVVMYALSKAFAPKPKQPSAMSEVQGRQQIVRTSIEPRRIIYGQIKVSGQLVYASTGGGDNRYLHMVIALAGHECHAIDDIYFNDTNVGGLQSDGTISSGIYSGLGVIRKHLGAPGQIADQFLIAEDPNWTQNHIGNGICYLYVKLTYDRSVFPTGIPTVSAIVRGKKLYDPRTGLTAFTDNWALICRDYLTSDFGLRCSSDEIDDSTFITAANLSDEMVALASGGGEKRYSANGSINLSMRKINIIEAMLSAGGGRLSYTQGKYRLVAAAYRTPVGSLSEDDLAGEIKVRPRPDRGSLYNAVRGVYVNASRYYQPSDFPAVTNALYESQDGERIFKDLDLPFTTSASTAQRIAKIWLEQSRQAIVFQGLFKPRVFKYSALDNIYLSIDTLGWVNKVFTIIDWRMHPTGEINLILQEEAAGVYDWNSGNETVIDLAPNTNLPDPFTVQQPGIPTITEALYETTGSAGVKSRMIVSWGAPSDVFVIEYFLEYKKSSESTWIVLGPLRDTELLIDDVEPAQYDFRVRARNNLGVLSPYSSSSKFEARGLLIPPVAVTNFSLMPLGSMAMLSWDRHPDLDVRIGGRIEIRYSTKTSGAVWEDGIPIATPFNGDAASGIVPLLSGTYLAKAVDSGGRFSISTTSVVTTAPNVLTFNVVETSSQDPVFPGIKSNLEVAAGKLRLGSLPLIDDVTDLIDIWPEVDSVGRTDVYTGTYLFDDAIDLGDVYTSRVTAIVTAVGVDNSVLVDGHNELIDTWQSIDGDAVFDANVVMFMRTTNDDPTGTPTWSDWKRFTVGDYTCRAYECRLDFETSDLSHNVEVSELSVIVDMPDRIESGNVITGTGADTTVNYAISFKSAAKVGLTIGNMMSGDVFEITAETASSFSFNVRNAGTRVARSVNWIAKSY